MAGSDTKCPVCGKSVGVGLVSGLLVQHETKYGERCPGSGGSAAPASSRGASGSGTRASSTRSSSASPRAGSKSAGASTPSRKAVTVRRVEVDPERLKRLEQKQQQLREERAAAARARNEFYSSGVSIDDDERTGKADAD